MKPFAFLLKKREEFIFGGIFQKEEFSLIESIRDEKVNKAVYRGTKAGIDTGPVEPGKLMYRFIELFKRCDYGCYKTLKTVFGQAILGKWGQNCPAFRKQGNRRQIAYINRYSRPTKPIGITATRTATRSRNTRQTSPRHVTESRKDKGRYRSLAKHRLWAYSCSLRINLVRIVNYCVKPSLLELCCGEQ